MLAQFFSKKHPLGIFLRGFLMGLCDMIPGISGGTIALITGIYQRFITLVKNLPVFVKELFILFSHTLQRKKTTKTFSTLWKTYDITFLFNLLIGILLAVVLLAHILTYLLEHYYSWVYSLIIGLILASTYLVWQHIPKKSFTVRHSTFLLIGLGIGLLTLLRNQSLTNPSLVYLFISAFLAISALFLPGISGSALLVLLGIYEVILLYVSEPFLHLIPLLVFLLGLLFGAIIISRIIHYCFAKDTSSTFFLLIGLMIGALVQPIISVFFTLPLTIYVFIFLVVGCLLPLLLIHWSQK